MQLGGEHLDRNRLEHTAALLAEALYDDPAYAFVFPSEGSRRAALGRFFALHLGNHMPQRCTLVHGTDQLPVAATVTVRPPGGVQVPKGRLLRAIAAFVAAVGPGALRRLLHTARVYDELASAAAGGAAHWHVHMMAVAPSLQGRGLGGALLARALSTRNGDAAPVVLTTHKAINVRFYERAGFRVVSERRLALDPQRGFTVWSMRLDALETPHRRDVSRTRALAKTHKHFHPSRCVR